MYNFDTSFMGFVQCPQSVIYMCLKPHLSYNEDTVVDTCEHRIHQRLWYWVTLINCTVICMLTHLVRGCGVTRVTGALGVVKSGYVVAPGSALYHNRFVK